MVRSECECVCVAYMKQITERFFLEKMAQNNKNLQRVWEPGTIVVYSNIFSVKTQLSKFVTFVR